MGDRLLGSNEWGFRMTIPKATLLFVGLALMLAPLAGCAATLSSDPIKGQVIEAGTGKPIPGAIVVVLWKGSIGAIGHGSTVCYHVETATTDEQGRYQTPAWKKPSPYGDIAHQQWMAMAYKPGYEMAGGRKGEVVLKVFAGTKVERMEFVSRAAVSCSHERAIEINLLPLYKALYEEARSLAVTREEKLKALYRLRDIERLELGSDKAWEKFRQREKEL